MVLIKALGNLKAQKRTYLFLMGHDLANLLRLLRLHKYFFFLADTDKRSAKTSSLAQTH